MRKTTLHIFILNLIVSIASVQVFAGVEEENSLKILDVQFEPIRQGKNIVRVKVQNTSGRDQTFRIQIYTGSPNYGGSGVGWGTSFFDTIKGHEAKWTRFAFKIQGPITDATYIRLDFHNPGLAKNFDMEAYFKKKERKKWFKTTKYSSSDIKHYEADESLTKPASKAESEAVIQTFRQIQNYITDKKYEQVWQLFTKDYRDAEFQVRASAFERFKKAMEPVRPIDSAFVWDKDEFLNLQPGRIVKKDSVFALEATCEGQVWTIDFLQENYGLLRGREVVFTIRKTANGKSTGLQDTGRVFCSG